MRRLVVQSDNHEEDIKASLYISEQTRRKDVDQVVWFSNMGKKVAEMGSVAERSSTQEKRIKELEDELRGAKRQLGDFKRLVNSIQEQVSRHDKLIPKEKKKKKDSDIKESVE